MNFQRTKTWKESNDPAKEAKLDRIEEILDRWPSGCSRSTSSGPWPCIPTRDAAGQPRAAPSACGPTTARHAGCGSSTPATRWATTGCGVSFATARGPTTPSPPCARSVPPVPTASGSLVLGQPYRVPLRSSARLRVAQLRPPQPCHPYPPPARIPALAQRQRRGSRPRGTAAPRTGPVALRAPASMVPSGPSPRARRVERPRRRGQHPGPTRPYSRRAGAFDPTSPLGTISAHAHSATKSEPSSFHHISNARTFVAAALGG